MVTQAVPGERRDSGSWAPAGRGSRVRGPELCPGSARAGLLPHPLPRYFYVQKSRISDSGACSASPDCAPSCARRAGRLGTAAARGQALTRAVRVLAGGSAARCQLSRALWLPEHRCRPTTHRAAVTTHRGSQGRPLVEVCGGIHPLASGSVTRVLPRWLCQFCPETPKKRGVQSGSFTQRSVGSASGWDRSGGFRDQTGSQGSFCRRRCLFCGQHRPSGESQHCGLLAKSTIFCA